MSRLLCGLMALAFCGATHAQTLAGVPPEKQAVVKRVLDKMGMDAVGLQMLQAPVAEMLRQSRVVVTSRVPADKQEAVLKEIAADASKFMADEQPVLARSTHAIVEKDVAPLLAKRFTVDELKQLAVVLESPVLAKFETIVPEMKRTVGENLAKANAGEIQPKMTALQDKVGQRMRAAIGQ